MIQKTKKPRPAIPAKDPTPESGQTVKATAPKQSPATTEARKGPARKRSPQIAREMLTVELRRVRSLFVEITERYLAETEGRIVALIDELEKRKLPMPCVERLLKDVRALSIKPRKGRRKDLGRIETLVNAFHKTLED